MRLGKVFVHVEYVVDLDNADMVESAKEMLTMDIREAVKYEDTYSWVNLKEDKTLTQADIPECLLEGDADG